MVRKIRYAINRYAVVDEVVIRFYPIFLKMHCSQCANPSYSHRPLRADCYPEYAY